MSTYVSHSCERVSPPPKFFQKFCSGFRKQFQSKKTKQENCPCRDGVHGGRVPGVVIRRVDRRHCHPHRAVQVRYPRQGKARPCFDLFLYLFLFISWYSLFRCGLECGPTCSMLPSRTNVRWKEASNKQTTNNSSAAKEMKFVRSQNQEYEEIDKTIHTEDVRNIRQVRRAPYGDWWRVRF